MSIRFPFLGSPPTGPARRRPGLPARRPRRALRLRDVLILTAPVALTVGYVTVGAVRDYQNLSRFDDWWTMDRSVAELFVRRAKLAVRSPMATLIDQRLEPDAADPAVVRLRVDRALWHDLQRDVQNTWGVWFDVELMRGNVVEDVNLRRRGDTSVHWTTGKMSFTLRTDRSSLFKGYRELGFSAADVLPQFVAGALTHEFDLIAPNTTVAPVFVNDRFYGLYQVNELIDESLLRRHGHMPGSIYRGDAAERGDAYKGVPRGLFSNASIWETPSINDRPAAPTETGMVGLLRDLNGDRFEDHLGLMSRLDRQEIARFIACMLVVGDLYHIDNLHNQFWYEDPWSGLLHPIPWDLRILDLAEPPLWVNAFLQAVLRDPLLIEATLRQVDEHLADDRILQVADSLARNTYARFRPHFEFEHLRQGVIAEVGEPESVLRVLRGNAQLLREWLSDARLATHVGSATGGTAILDIESRGYAGADLVALNVEGSGDLDGLQVRADRNRNGRPDADDPIIRLRATPGSGGARFELEAPEALLSGWNTRGVGIQPGAVHYRFFLDGQPRSGKLTAITVEARNRITGERATVISLDAGAPLTPTRSWSPWQYPVAPGRTVRWSGLVEVRDTVRIAATDTLVVAPGTTVRLYPEASIVARGHVRAEGRAEAPIEFVPADEARPWGVLALQGEAAGGSSFRHVRFTGGSGAVLDRVEYSGMVNVHWARNVTFDSTAFARNLRMDDTFHAVQADVDLSHCSFDGANSDAVDYDYSTGEIRDCRFTGSGNDAIDLMTSSPLVLNNRIVGSGDKGISVGEDSHPLIFNNHISGSTRGIEVKDRSAPLLVHNVITDNGIGLLQNVKNWRYGAGGRAKLINTLVTGNVSDFEADDDSRLSQPVDVSAASMLTGPGQQATAIDATWALAPYGIRAFTAAAGLVPAWERMEPVAPLATAEFRDDFQSVADGWMAQGRVVRLEKRRQSLIASLEPGWGGMALPVSWDLARTGAGTLVLELASRDAESVTVKVTGSKGTITRSAEVPAAEGVFGFVTIELPPDHYTLLEIGAIAQPGVWEIDGQTGFVDTRKARLELAGYRVVPVSAGAGPASGGPVAGIGTSAAVERHAVR